MEKTNGSRQTYLKTIRELRRDGARVRNADIASALGYARPSVTAALKKLAAEGYIRVEKGAVILTGLGEEAAKEAEEKSRVLTDFFLDLGAAPASARENARRAEPVLTDDLFELIRERRK